MARARRGRMITCADCGEYAQNQGWNRCLKCVNKHYYFLKGRKTYTKNKSDPMFLQLQNLKKLLKNLEAYNLDYITYLGMLSRGCAICGTHTSKPCFDHDHQTGRFRGILCQPCNCAIGLLGDSSNGAKKAWEYLKNYEQKAKSA